MNLTDLLESVGGQQSLGRIAGNLGLDVSKTNELVDALAPVLMGALRNQAGSQESLAALRNALQNGNHQDYLDNPESMLSAQTVKDGNNILGHLLGSKDVSRQVAAQAAVSTGIDSSQIKQALPLLAGLVMGAMSKRSHSGSLLEDYASDMFENLTGGDGFGMDDVFNIAKRFL